MCKKKVCVLLGWERRKACAVRRGGGITGGLCAAATASHTVRPRRRSMGLGRCCSSMGLWLGPFCPCGAEALLPAGPGPDSAQSRRLVRCGAPMGLSPVLSVPGFAPTSLGARQLPQPSAGGGLRGLGVGKAHGAVSCPCALPAPCHGLSTGGEAGSAWHWGISAALIQFFLDWMEPQGDLLLQPRSSTCQPSRAAPRGDGLGHAGGFFIPVLLC